MTYRTSVSDPFLRLLVFLAISFVGMVAVLAMVDVYSMWLIVTIYLLIMLVLSYFVMKLLSCGVVETELTHDRMHVRWIEQPPLLKQADEDILFAHIKEDGFMTSRVQKVYTLFLKDGREFSYNQFNLFAPRKQNIEAMGRDIRARIEDYHERNPEPWVPLGYEKNTDPPMAEEEQKRVSARMYISFLAVVAIFLMIGFPLLKMIFPASPLLWDLKVLGIVVSILLLLAKVFGSLHQRMQAGDTAEAND